MSKHDFTKSGTEVIASIYFSEFESGCFHPGETDTASCRELCRFGKGKYFYFPIANICEDIEEMLGVKHKSQNGLPLETKHTQNHENRRLDRRNEETKQLKIKRLAHMKINVKQFCLWKQRTHYRTGCLGFIETLHKQ